MVQNFFFVAHLTFRSCFWCINILHDCMIYRHWHFFSSLTGSQSNQVHNLMMHCTYGQETNESNKWLYEIVSFSSNSLCLSYDLQNAFKIHRLQQWKLCPVKLLSIHLVIQLVGKPMPSLCQTENLKKKKKTTGPNNCAELYEYDLFCPKLSRPHFLPDFCNCPYSTTLILFVYFRSVQQSLSSPPDVWIASPRVFYFSSALSKSATALEREGLDVSVSRWHTAFRDNVITLRSRSENDQQYTQPFNRSCSITQTVEVQCYHFFHKIIYKILSQDTVYIRYWV